MRRNLEGRFAIVTGATRGIGRAVAERLLRDGARVLGTGSSAHGEIPAGCEYRAVDFTDEAATGAFAQDLRAAAPDILVNNAGVNRLASFADIAPADFLRLQRVNVFAPMLLCQAVIGAMCSRGWGRIVNVASIWSMRSLAGRGSYSASKFALDGMTAALAAEVAASNVLANCVSPGFIDTEMLRVTIGAEGIGRMVAQVPAGRLGTPQEVAAFVAWLAGPENTFISGQNIAIDGGYTRT